MWNLDPSQRLDADGSSEFWLNCRWFIPKMKMVIYYSYALTLIQTVDNLEEKKSSMRRLRFLQRGLTLTAFFIVDEEREEPNTIKSGS